MRRFFADVSGEDIVITGDDAHHIANVLRLGCGEIIAICDKLGFDYVCEIVSVSKNEVLLKAKEKHPSKGEPKTKVTLYQALLKGDKFEFVIQKAVELGVDRIVPCDSERCVTKIDAKKAKAKTERWNKIAESAAKQSGRGIIPKVEMPMTFKKAAEDFLGRQLPVMAYEEEQHVSLKKVLTQTDATDIGLFIGSEGGFAPKEAHFLVDGGAKSVTLGKRILRAETAPIATLAMIFYERE